MSKTTVIENAGMPHALSMNERKSMSLTGVNEVLSFDETLVCLKTACGNMHISGKDLHIHALVLEQGSLQLSGQIDAVSYTNQGLRGKRTLRDLLR